MSDPTSPILEARKVVKTYHTGAADVQALRGLDLTVHPGEMVAVVGPSGSGKTTLLNCLSGLDEIDEGEVFIAGEEIHSMPDRVRTSFRGREMGFVFQAFNLIQVFTAAENVELPLLLNGVPPKEARRRAESVLELVGLGHRLSHRPPELSGGEQQRVAIARALAASPSIVWADEPTGNLDSVTAEQVMTLLRRLNEDGLTVILVTHDLAIARTASRIVSMHDGQIVGDEPQP
ncbi:MAG TPA: ABC transporter ATP-binding protein [Actinomycetota bacterium]